MPAEQRAKKRHHRPPGFSRSSGGYSRITIPKSVEAAAATFLAIRSHSIDNALSLLPSPRRRACPYRSMSCRKPIGWSHIARFPIRKNLRPMPSSRPPRPLRSAPHARARLQRLSRPGKRAHRDYRISQRPAGHSRLRKPRLPGRLASARRRRRPRRAHCRGLGVAAARRPGRRVKNGRPIAECPEHCYMRAIRDLAALTSRPNGPFPSNAKSGSKTVRMVRTATKRIMRFKWRPSWLKVP